MSGLGTLRHFVASQNLVAIGDKVDIAISGQLVGNIAGLLLIALGGATMVLAIIRFRQTALDIDSAETRPGSGDRMDVILAALLVILGAALFVYLSYTLISRI